jgi:hypothetical protein
MEVMETPYVAEVFVLPEDRVMVLRGVTATVAVLLSLDVHPALERTFKV